MEEAEEDGLVGVTTVVAPDEMLISALLLFIIVTIEMLTDD